MKQILVLGLLGFVSVPICLAEAVPSHSETGEPTLHDHLKAMEQSQERLMKLSTDEQTRLQPQIQQAEREACVKLSQDRNNGIGMDEYRAQGGEQFTAFVMQFEQYCRSLH